MKIGNVLGIGNTAIVYEWGKTEVIKIFHDHFNSVYEAQKEAENAEMISKLQVRSPRYSGTIEYGGKCCLIYERVDGPTMLWSIEPQMDSISYFAKQMAQLQLEIYHVQIPLPSNLTKQMKKTIHDATVLSEDEKKMVIDQLNGLPEGNAVCHYDFHPDNIIMSAKGPIVIDWMNALIGNQAADVARTSMMLLSHSAPPNAPKWLVDRRCREHFNKEYIKEYQALTGIDNAMLDEWIVPTIAYRIGEMNNHAEHENVVRIKKILEK